MRSAGTRKIPSFSCFDMPTNTLVKPPPSYDKTVPPRPKIYGLILLSSLAHVRWGRLSVTGEE